MLPIALLLLACADIPKVDDSAVAPDADADGYPDGEDCDDSNEAVNPAAPEMCNGADDDCDQQVDEGATDAATWYADFDGDSFGDADAPVTACEAPAGSVADATDCDDGAATIHPGATESCNEGDDDCDSVVDEDAVDAPTWYADADGDGHGDQNSPMAACEAPEGATATSDDCDDDAASVHPEAPELCDGVDDDCDEATADVGTVSLVAPDGSVTDVTAQFTPATEGVPVTATLDPGDYLFCDGTWPVSLRVGGGTTLRSLNGPDVTTLTGGGVATVVTVGDTGTALTLRGLTLTGGVPDAVDFAGLGYLAGGALDCQGASGVTVEDAVFTANTAEAGGAIFAYVCALDIRRTTFTGNTGDRGGAVFTFDGNVTATDSTFEGNVAAVTGGALYVRGGAQYNVATLANTTVIGNDAFYGGALAVIDYGGLSCGDASRIVGNAATYGGGLYYSPMVGSEVASTGCDWGTPEIDDNTPHDVDVQDSGSHAYFSWSGTATFTCTDAGCT